MSEKLLGIDVYALAKITPHHRFGPMLAALREAESAKQAGDLAGLKKSLATLGALRDVDLGDKCAVELHKLFAHLPLTKGDHNVAGALMKLGR